MDQISRRRFLQIAGGITYLALVPRGRGLFAAEHADSALPLFTALPYIQPGEAGALRDGHDTLTVAWQTEDGPGEFEVSYGLDKTYSKTATVVMARRPEKAGVMRVSYHANLTGLRLDHTYYYRVRGNGQTIAEGYAATRKPRGHKIRFVSFGDNSCGSEADHAIAYQAYQARPDFVMNTGDNVYNAGRDGEYTRYFFPVYNADTASPSTGAPLLRSVPYYTVLANHDLNAQEQTVADFDHAPDGLGYYTAMHLPQSRLAPSYPTPLTGDPGTIAHFRDCAGPRYPNMANYAFDYGDAHFLCVDANVYIDPTNKALQDWIAHDLSHTDALWKFVVFHHPPFNVGGEHYAEQHMRALSPLFEAHGVDMVLSGHEHTYQRTRPIRFEPTDLTRAKTIDGKDRRVPGKFTVDTAFDGDAATKPSGIIYITNGAGGNDLYDPGYTDNPDRWLHEDDNNVAYVAKFHSVKHSLTVIDIDGHSLHLTQVDEDGNDIDHVHVTK
jgi:hypothetical protein